MALVLLHSFMTSMEAAMVRSRLGVEGIETHLFDVEEVWDTTSHLTVPVRLLVAEEDEEEARTILARALAGDFALGDDEEG
jgi:hypothetical protein